MRLSRMWSGGVVVEAKCPSCGTDGAYRGLRDVECLNSQCRSFSQAWKDEAERSRPKPQASGEVRPTPAEAVARMTAVPAVKDLLVKIVRHFRTGLLTDYERTQQIDDLFCLSFHEPAPEPSRGDDQVMAAFLKLASDYVSDQTQGTRWWTIGPSVEKLLSHPPLPPDFMREVISKIVPMAAGVNPGMTGIATRALLYVTKYDGAFTDRSLLSP